MRKEEIISIVRNPKYVNGTVLSFPNRGMFGNNRYRGNCSGYIHAFLIDQYNVKYMGEMYAGGGTGYDVCKDMGIDYVGADLNPNPVRCDKIYACNALTDEIPEEFSEVDFVFQHMPYPEIGIKYAGSEYPDPTGELALQDIGQMDFHAGMLANNKVTIKLYNAMHPGAKMGILCGNIRRNGRYHDMMLSLALPGEVIQNIVKMQHNCVSDGRIYSKKNFVPITHENLIILQKPFEHALYVGYLLPVKKGMDIRDSISSTWRDVIRSVMYEIGGRVHYKKIVDSIKGHKKAESNHNLDAKVRQVLRMYERTFIPCGDGVYQLRENFQRSEKCT